MMVFFRRHSFILSTLAILALALIARAGALKQYVTPDEPAWVQRSLSFTLALQRGDWASTAQIGHPGVTTMWLGSVGIAIKRLADPAAASEAIEWLKHVPGLAPENAEAFKRLGVFLTFARIPVIIVNALGVVGLYGLLRRLFDQRIAVLAAVLIALDPFVASLSGLLHVDGLLTTFSSLAVLSLLNGIGLAEARSRIRNQKSEIIWFALSGIFAALAFLSKSPALFLTPFTLLVVIIAIITKKISIKHAAIGLIIFVICHLSFVILLYPAMWRDPIGTFNGIVGLASFYSVNPVRPSFFDGQYVLNHGLNFYPTALIHRLTPVVMIGLVVALIAIVIDARRNAGGLRVWSASRERGDKTGFAPHPVPFATCLLLLAFSVLYLVFITPVAKKYDRYMLPAFILLIPIAAWGLMQIRWRGLLPIVLIAQGFIVVSNWPSLLMHYNALLGGAAEAQQHFAVGWGEGLGAAANWINQQPNGLQSTVASAAIPSFAPIFSGRSASMNDRGLELSDYFVITLSERQLNPDLFAQLQQRGSIVHTIYASNVEAAWVLINDRAQQQARQLNQANPQTDAIVTLIDLPVSRAYQGAAQLVKLPREVTPTQIEDTLNDLSTRYRRLWFAWSDAASMVAQDQMRQWLSQTASPAQPTGFGATRIAAYDLRPHRLGQIDPLLVQFNGNFALLGLNVTPRHRTVLATLRWQSLAANTAPYSTVLQLIDAQGEVWDIGGGLIQNQDQFASNEWPIGHVADQLLNVNLPAEAPPGHYGLRVSVDQSDGQRVGLFSSSGSFSGTAPLIASFDLPPLDRPLVNLNRSIEYPYTHRWADQLELLGFDNGPGVVINGDLWTVNVVWRGLQSNLPDLGVVWEVRDQHNQKLFSTRLPLSPYSTSQWREGEVIAAHYTLRWPVDVPAADYHVSLGVTAPDGTLLDGGMFMPFDVRLLPRQRSFTQPITPTLDISFSDPAIQLIHAQFPTTPFHPGDSLPVTLYWKAGTTTEVLYTVFVHLESLDGQVIAQRDSAPQGGGMPTASWATDQIIEDAYPLTIPANTPPGAYRIVVGMYNPLDGTHLVDAATGQGEVVLDPPVVVK